MGRASRATALFGLFAMLLGAAVAGASEPLTLTDAVRQTLSSNLDLAAQRKSLDADREQIGIMRSVLLPQIEAGAQGQILEGDRADGQRGNVSAKSATVSAALSQVLYDDDAWAGYSIQKHLYAAQKSEFESFRLGVIAESAQVFLALELAEAVVRIQEENREITSQNIETAKARVAVGYSGQRDVLRWQAQLSANDTAVVEAKTRTLISRFELNQVRDRPGEEPVDVAESKLATYGFMYARDTIAKAVSEAERDRRLRDFMVRVGLARSPSIAAIDSAIAAEERQVTAGRRAFWVPTLSFGAGVNHLAAKESTGGAAGTMNDTEWGVASGLSIPLLQGGERFAALRQSQSTLSSLRIQRRAEGQSIDESIRQAFAQASGSYASLGFAKQQEATARENFDLVNASYVAGVTSILDLLDAQTQLLEAGLGVVDAYYGFLSDLVTAEQETNFFPFLEPSNEVSSLLDQLEVQLR